MPSNGYIKTRNVTKKGAHRRVRSVGHNLRGRHAAVHEAGGTRQSEAGTPQCGGGALKYWGYARVRGVRPDALQAAILRLIFRDVVHVTMRTKQLH